ncbi:MAG: DUF2183 domain-containing protein [Saprospiraceae bacterium]|nr:DUF2183 domain-containing protein [Saprospiraceae bacterium]
MLSKVPYIETYRGFAGTSRVIFNCRLLKDQNHYANLEDSLWKNLRNIFRKVASREIPYGEIEISLNGSTYQARADNEGYVFIDAPTQIQFEPNAHWKEVTLNSKKHTFQCEYLVPSSKATYGIISDIDDTILVTDVHSPVRMIYNSLIKNPFQRQAFNGIKEFYKEKTVQGHNPVFYLSNSPWNLYQNIKQFLDIQMLPKGPILLRDYGMHFPTVPKAYSHHKENNIELLLEVYPDLSFVLIGDASQEDAIIYSHIKNKYPQRIKKILIREVSNPKNMAKIASNREVDMKSIHFFNTYEDLITLDL